MIAISYPWLFLLLPLPYLAWRYLPAHPPKTMVHVPFGDRLDEVIGTSRAERIGKSSFLAPSLIWILLVLALTRPQWIGDPIERTDPTRDLLLLVDLSGSMEQEDFKNHAGEAVSRLTAVKEIVGDFLEKRKGDRVGLVVFGDSPFLQAPFSTDLSLSRRLLEETEVGMAGPRTALGDAIGLGIHLFENSVTPAKTVIAMTDGNDTKSLVPPVEAARIAKQNDIRIHTVSIGDPTTVGEDKLDQKTLDNVAMETGGKSFFAADREQLESIYEELDRLETREIKTLSYSPRHDLYFLPVAAALLLSWATKITFHPGFRQRRVSGEVLRVNPRTGALELSAPLSGH